MADFFGIPRQRIPVAVALVIALAFGLSWLQGRFDTSDVKKAIAIAMAHKPSPTGPTVFDAIASLKEGDPVCEGHIVSTFFGDVKTSCWTPGKPGVRYEFRILLDNKRPLKGDNDEARKLLAALGEAAPDAGR